MTLEILPQMFSVCKVASLSDADCSQPFCFIGKTDQEISLVCESSRSPANALAKEDGFRALRIAGTLDFSLIGILAGISGLLAQCSISIFALSTFNTDYILLHEKDSPRALDALAGAGYTLRFIDAPR